MLGQMGEKLADFHSRLSVLIERERATQPGSDLRIVSSRQAFLAVSRARLLSAAFSEFRLRVEEVYVAWSAVLEQEDDSLCLGREVRLLGQDIEFHGTGFGCRGVPRD